MNLSFYVHDLDPLATYNLRHEICSVPGCGRADIECLWIEHDDDTDETEFALLCWTHGTFAVDVLDDVHSIVGIGSV